MDWKIPLAEPIIGAEEIDSVVEVLKSKWLTMGSVTQEFERSFAEKLGVKFAFAVHNCTEALHLANLAVGTDRDSEVICPALTFVASANASRYCGAKVVFADVISEKDLTVDPAEIERLVTPRTKAITVVHYGGYACRMDEIMTIARKHRLRVIEDCAHAPFAVYRSQDGTAASVGSIGDVGCFSFFGNKNMTTGEGGMITTNDGEIADKIRLMRSHGMTTLTYERHKGHAHGYDVVSLGYNYRSDEIHSAIGLRQLEKIDRINARRRELTGEYMKLLAGCDKVIVPFDPGRLEDSVCHIMPVIIKENYEKVREALKEAGVQTSKHYDLIPTFSFYRDSKFHTRYESLSRLMTLPLYSGMDETDVSYVCDVIMRNA